MARPDPDRGVGRVPLDLLLVHPGGSDIIYQGLKRDLTAIEPPLWCRLIAGYARDRGISVQILDSQAEAMGPESLALRVKELAPRLVAVAVFGHQPSASTQSMVGARLCCQAIKNLEPGRTILILGGHVSALPERTLREEPVDYACVGEGPVTVVELLQALESDIGEVADRDWRPDVPGLVWWRDEEVVINKPATLIEDLDEDLHGDVWDLLPMDKYRAHNWQCFDDPDRRQPYASIYTTLGCPYSCTFCCVNAPFGDKRRYRRRSPEKVVEEIKLLHDRYGVKTFKIIDEMFVLNAAHVRAICDGIVRSGLTGLNFWAYARVDTVRADLLGPLRSAGFRWLALGIESGSALVRDGAGKGLGEDEILTTVRTIQEAGIAVIGNFIFGLPDDTMASMRETLDLARSLNCEFANFYTAMAYPGSVLHKTAVRKGWALPDAWSGYSQHSYDCLPLATDHVDAATVLGFRDAAFHEYFESARYLDMVTQRFGWRGRHEVEAMTKSRLRRAITDKKG